MKTQSNKNSTTLIEPPSEQDLIRAVQEKFEPFFHAIQMETKTSKFMKDGLHFGEDQFIQLANNCRNIEFLERIDLEDRYPKKCKDNVADIFIGYLKKEGTQHVKSGYFIYSNCRLFKLNSFEEVLRVIDKLKKLVIANEVLQKAELEFYESEKQLQKHFEDKQFAAYQLNGGQLSIEQWMENKLYNRSNLNDTVSALWDRYEADEMKAKADKLLRKAEKMLKGGGQ